jgi:2-dehydro-3-deoxy-D-gluconate 5-dehydrogenase
VVFFPGIGAACATALAEAGAALCLVLRPQSNSSDDQVESLRRLGAATVNVVHCDLADLEAVKGLFQKGVDAMGGSIDVLVNCAGIQRRSPSVEFSERDWDDVSELY